MEGVERNLFPFSSVFSVVSFLIKSNHYEILLETDIFVVFVFDFCSGGFFAAKGGRF
jgi:hypothetical protein